MSKPVFLGASNALRDGIVGLATPDASIHDTWLGVEPISGQTLDYHFRLGESTKSSEWGARRPGHVTYVGVATFRPSYLPINVCSRQHLRRACARAHRQLHVL